MKAIGGYMPLELSKGTEYHSQAIRVNTGRNALELIIRKRQFRKLFLPYYTCPVLLQPIRNCGISFEYYSIDGTFEPVFDFSKLGPDEGFLYTNYFGLKDEFIARIAPVIRNLIIDNAQAFFSRPVQDVDTFYSARKFFGVPDGAYLYCNSETEIELDEDLSLNRCEHLLTRIDKSAEEGYTIFAKNDQLFDDVPLRKMSQLSQAILDSIDYQGVAKIRRDNFNYLHKSLGVWNELPFELNESAVPLAYPFLCNKLNSKDLRHTLTHSQVYTPQYWKEVPATVSSVSLESIFAMEIVPLPLDQTLTKRDLDYILNLIAP